MKVKEKANPKAKLKAKVRARVKVSTEVIPADYRISSEEYSIFRALIENLLIIIGLIFL